MKKEYRMITRLMVATVAMLLFTACSKDSDGGEVQKPWTTTLESVAFVPDVEDGEALIVIDGSEPVTLTYQVTPADMAAFMAQQPIENFALVANGLTLTIVSMEATEDGQLTVTAVVEGAEVGHTYPVTLQMSDGKRMFTSDVVKIYREALLPGIITLGSEAVSQTLAE